MAKAIEEQFKYTEHERKPVIRSQWCLPQIELLFQRLRKKLIYIGLPGIEALDVLAWIDYLDKVIAFQCSEYKEGSSTKQIDVIQLDNLLEKLEREDKLTSSIVYQGFMEDIVMGGLSERGQTYSQNEFLKVYNLDFCNNISTPREIRNEKGKLVYHYKLQVIERLLQYQQKTANEDKGSKFIMYLTVNSDIFNGDVSKIKETTFTGYFKQLNKINKAEVKAIRLMKAYCFHEIATLFEQYGFNVEFLPPIFYMGSSYPNQNRGSKDQHHRMMTFTILGTNAEKAKPYKQDIKTFLESKFVFATNDGFQCFSDRFIEESDFDPNAADLLANSHTYKFLW